MFNYICVCAQVLILLAGVIVCSVLCECPYATPFLLLLCLQLRLHFDLGTESAGLMRINWTNL